MSATFEIGSNSNAAPNPVGEATAFFTRFKQAEMNDLDLADFWGTGPPYVDFHRYLVLEDCVVHLQAVYSRCGDFIQGFALGCFVRENFLKLLGYVMNDIKHNFIGTISAKKI